MTALDTLLALRAAVLEGANPAVKQKLADAEHDVSSLPRLSEAARAALEAEAAWNATAKRSTTEEKQDALAEGASWRRSCARSSPMRPRTRRVNGEPDRPSSGLDQGRDPAPPA